MRKLILAFLLCSSPAAFAQGGCSAFAGGSCTANVPTGVTSFYFIDATSGSDSNTGASEASAFLHAPGCTNATSNAASANVSSPNTGWIIKGGTSLASGCYPMQLPWGGTSGNPTYLGYDPGWGSGRPILNGGGSSGYNANSGAMVGDSAHLASFLVVDNIEFTGLYFQGTNCATTYNDCNYLATVNALTSFPDTSWEVRNIYVHNITHGACVYSGGICTGTNDPANTGATIHTPRDAASSVHDSYFDNTDGSADCCMASDAAVVYHNYYSGWSNVVFNPSASSQQETIFLWHDNYITNMETTFYPATNGNEPHGNCIHVFGTNASTFKELIYNNYVNCTNANAENFEVEEDNAVVYYFNNVNTNTYQPNGYDTKSFSGAGSGGTYYFFQNTIECGIDATPGYICQNLGPSSSPVQDINIFGITKGVAIGTRSGWTGTITYAPDISKTCGSNTTPHFGGALICAPVGTGNGTGNLNFTETYPFAPLDSTAAATVGTASATALRTLCTTISGINSAAGTACLSDTTLGVTPNSVSHTVSFPARTSVVRPTSGNWRIGAYEFVPPNASSSTCTPAGGVYTATQTPACTNPNSGTTVQCYTTNGTTPATSGDGVNCATGTALTSGGTVSITTTGTTLKIIAGTSTLTDSPVNSYTYTLQGSAPTASPGPGTYTSTQTVTLSQAQGQSMGYTTDGSTPTSNGSGTLTHGTAYTTSLTVSSTQTIKAIGYASGFTDSAVGSFAYTIVAPSTVSCLISGGTIISGGTVCH